MSNVPYDDDSATRVLIGHLTTFRAQLKAAADAFLPLGVLGPPFQSDIETGSEGLATMSRGVGKLRQSFGRPIGEHLPRALPDLTKTVAVGRALAAQLDQAQSDLTAAAAEVRVLSAELERFIHLAEGREMS